MSPPLRLSVHASTCLVGWSALLACWSGIVGLSDVCLAATGGGGGSSSSSLPFTLAFYQSGFVFVATYLYVLYVAHHKLPGVSDPGGPRPHKIQRAPKWDNVNHEMPPSARRKWRFSVAEESHEVTDARLAGTSAALTGEPSGRDIWTTAAAPTNKASKQRGVDEKLVQEMASGGRTPVGSSFNPSINPNSCDVPFRAQMIRNYVASGKAPPSTKEPALTVEDSARKAVHFYSMLQTDDGHWSGDYGGPMFLMPGLVVAWYVMGKPSKMLDGDEIEMMKYYFVVHQQSDGGWGTHSK